AAFGMHSAKEEDAHIRCVLERSAPLYGVLKERLAYAIWSFLSTALRTRAAGGDALPRHHRADRVCRRTRLRHRLAGRAALLPIVLHPVVAADPGDGPRPADHAHPPGDGRGATPVAAPPARGRRCGHSGYSQPGSVGVGGGA